MTPHAAGTRTARILVVDDEPGMLRYMKTLLEADAHEVELANSGPSALERLKQREVPDLTVLDLAMPGMDGLETLQEARRLQPDAKIVMLTCASDPRKAVHAIRLGAYEYLTKPFDKAELDAIIQRCIAERHARQEQQEQETAADEPGSGELVDLGGDRFFWAASPAMRRVRQNAAQVAAANVPVFILGESGSGKEVVARLIHKLSPRAHRTFLKVNCAALPGELLESELFGYEEGAFTGATRSKPGKFELCHRGTMLLDEIGEMPTALQSKLLHVLQDGQFSRLGSRTNVEVDVRILAATNVNIKQAIAARRFREDLYYRLNAFTIHLPPLRERKQEIPFLLRQYVARLADSFARPALPMTQAMLDACLRYDWPGNVRELENFAKRYVIFGDANLALADLQASEESNAPPARPALAGGLKSLVRGIKGEAEAEAIAAALRNAGGVRKAAARALNISYKALLYKIRQYGLD